MRYRSDTGQFPQASGPTPAKPSGDHTPLGMALPRLVYGITPRLFSLLGGRNVPRIIRGSAEPQPSIINEKTVADFTRVAENTANLDRARCALDPTRDEPG